MARSRKTRWRRWQGAVAVARAMALAAAVVAAAVARAAAALLAAALVMVTLGGLTTPRLAAADELPLPIPATVAPSAPRKNAPVPISLPDLPPLPPVYTAPTDTMHRIELSRGEHARIEYLAPLPLQVRYVNDAPTALELGRPEDSSLNVLRWYRPLLDRESRGRIFGTPGHCESLTREDGSAMYVMSMGSFEKMTLPARGQHRFTTTWQGEAGWLEDVGPGQWRVWIDDSFLQTVSNQVTVDVVFTGLSLATCLQIVPNPQEPDYKRKELSRWLEKLVPGLQFDWWGSSETEDAVKAAKELGVQQRFATCRAYIFDPANAAAVDAAIAAINAEAFSVEINGRRVPIAPAKD